MKRDDSVDNSTMCVYVRMCVDGGGGKSYIRIILKEGLCERRTLKSGEEYNP